MMDFKKELKTVLSVGDKFVLYAAGLLWCRTDAFC